MVQIGIFKSLHPGITRKILSGRVGGHASSQAQGHMAGTVGQQ